MVRHLPLAARRRATIAYHSRQCWAHLTAANDAERAGRTRQADTLRCCALRHYELLQQEQELLNLMIEEEVPTVFRQSSMFEERQAA